MLKIERWRRSERVIFLTKALVERPHFLYPLGYFSQQLSAAKSSLSEDLALIKETLNQAGLGEVVTVSGAMGGVRYLPYLSPEREKNMLDDLAQKLSDPSRILPGGYLYMLDLIYDPYLIDQLGQIFARRFAHCQPDYIVTVETKGIPMATMTARAFNVPLVVIRNDSRVTEGSAVSINYVSGSSKKIGTMTLARRAIKPNSKVILIDDFMKAGGTAYGMMELMSEFNVKVEGVGVFISTAQPKQKKVKDYLSLLELVAIDDVSGLIDVRNRL